MSAATDPSQPNAAAAASPREANGDVADAHAFAIDAARLLNYLNCQDVQLLDVRELSDLTRFILIASGTSDRQLRSVARELEALGKAQGFSRYGRDADKETLWIVTDFVEVVAHLFEPVTRAHYDLEMLWGDAKPIRWRRDSKP